MAPKRQSPVRQLHLVLGLLLIACLWLQCALATDVRIHDHDCESVEDSSLARHCAGGGYIVNPNPGQCKDRYFCYRLLKEECDDNVEKRCHPSLSCRCGQCMNCMGNECNVQLCPLEAFFKRWYKRFEKSSLEA